MQITPDIPSRILDQLAEAGVPVAGLKRRKCPARDQHHYLADMARGTPASEVYLRCLWAGCGRWWPRDVPTDFQTRLASALREDELDPAVQAAEYDAPLSYRELHCGRVGQAGSIRGRTPKLGCGTLWGVVALRTGAAVVTHCRSCGSWNAVFRTMTGKLTLFGISSPRVQLALAKQRRSGVY